tara:strand:- start:2640 stop:2936 length:297 start_codon:yes stop_codon:yes gene_type:complete
MKLSFNPRVNRDVADAADWYDTRREGLGDDFYQEVEAMLEQILDNPKGFPFGSNSTEIRKASLRRFPFGILYRQSSESIRVLCVRHNKRHPHYGTNRK